MWGLLSMSSMSLFRVSLPLDLGGASRRTAGLSPSEARGRERSDLDSHAAGATIIPVQGEGVLSQRRLNATWVVSVVRR